MVCVCWLGFGCYLFCFLLLAIMIVRSPLVGVLEYACSSGLDFVFTCGLIALSCVF